MSIPGSKTKTFSPRGDLLNFSNPTGSGGSDAFDDWEDPKQNRVAVNNSKMEEWKFIFIGEIVYFYYDYRESGI
jgi:hypothetical protein